MSRKPRLSVLCCVVTVLSCLAAGGSAAAEKADPHRDQLAKSQKTWQALKAKCGGNYAYKVRFTSWVGFGNETATFKAKPVRLEEGTWHRLGFSYDGAGTVRILLDGRHIGGGSRKEFGPIAPTPHPLVVGGRVGSTHYGCAAFLDDLKLSTRSP